MNNITIRNCVTYGPPGEGVLKCHLGDGTTIENLFCCPTGMSLWHRLRAAWVLINRATRAEVKK